MFRTALEWIELQARSSAVETCSVYKLTDSAAAAALPGLGPINVVAPIGSEHDPAARARSGSDALWNHP